MRYSTANPAPRLRMPRQRDRRRKDDEAMSDKLGRELWKAIETPQGYAYLSDSIENMPDEEVLQLAAGAMEWHRESIRVLKKFLNTSLAPPPAQPAPGE